MKVFKINIFSIKKTTTYKYIYLLKKHFFLNDLLSLFFLYVPFKIKNTFQLQTFRLMIAINRLKLKS